MGDPDKRDFFSDDGGAARQRFRPNTPHGLKPKDLAGIPWRVAFALQADGWILRSDIIWAKPSCLPENVQDRPTKMHEYIFLLAKSDRYFFDTEAIREESPGMKANAHKHMATRLAAAQDGGMNVSLEDLMQALRNRRSVWSVSPESYPGAHFATWPTDLVDLMVKAGSSERGCCPTCLAPMNRIVDKVGNTTGRHLEYGVYEKATDRGISSSARVSLGGEMPLSTHITVGWEKSCTCPDFEPIRCTVMDTFSGSGTTGVVSLAGGRNYTGLDLNKGHYLDLAYARLNGLSAPKKPSEDKVVDPISSMFGE